MSSILLQIESLQHYCELNLDPELEKDLFCLFSPFFQAVAGQFKSIYTHAVPGLGLEQSFNSTLQKL